jgi:O-antigen ligase
MMSVPSATSARFLFPGFGIVIIGILVALATDMALAQLTLVKFAFILGGFAMLIPTMVLKNPKAYWLFLLVLSIPFDISKRMSAWLVDPQTLVDAYGQPASGTVALEPYLTDVLLIAMLLPWLARVCIRRHTLYFPAIGYIYVFYLAWALLVSVINAESLYLSMFELSRQVLYLLSFVYLINNVTTRLQFRSVVWAVFLGFIIGASTVITFFELGYGTGTSVFASLHDQPTTIGQSKAYKPSKAAPAQDLTLYGTGRRFGNAPEEGLGPKRSQGMFGHPAIPASLCGLILPIVLAYLMAARNNRDRILFFTLFVLGIAALVLTFSRAGAIGLAAGIGVVFAVGGWSGLISRRVLVLGAVTLTWAAALGIPLLLVYFETRPESFYMRFNLFEAALQGYSQHPILGVGLNNSTGAMNASKQEFRDIGILMPRTEATDSLYLAVLTEVGPVGFILFFVFFGKLVMIALRALREAATDLKPLLVGIVAGLASLATHNLADDTLGGHSVSGILWLFAALIVTAARDIQAETRVCRARRPVICGPAS